MDKLEKDLGMKIDDIDEFWGTVKNLRNSVYTSSRNIDIFCERYAYHGYVDKTYGEIADKFQLSKSRTQQIVQNSLRIIGHLYRNRKRS